MEHYELEQQLIQNVVKAGAYLIGLFACSRLPWPHFEDGDLDSDEEEKSPYKSPVKSPAKKRGGTDGNSVATQKGSAMIIHACP